MPARAQLLAAPLPAPQRTPPPLRRGIEGLGSCQARTLLQSAGVLVLMEVCRALCYEERPSFRTVIAHARMLSLKYFLFHFT